MKVSKDLFCLRSRSHYQDFGVIAKRIMHGLPLFVFILIIVPLLLAAKSDDWEKRLKKVKRMKNQAELATVATTDSHQAVRIAAVERISDQAVLVGVVLNDDDSFVREAAIAHISSPEALVQVIEAAKDYSRDEREAALNRLSNHPDVLRRLAVEGKNPLARAGAVERISDQEFLAAVCRNDPHFQVTKTAINRISDPTLLADLAENSPDDAIRRLAVEKVSDAGVLTKIARTHPSAFTRAEAAGKITDPIVLKEIALKDSAIEPRIAAIKRIEDQAFLKQLALAEQEEKICWMVVDNLHDPASLAQVARQAANKIVRRKAVSKLDDPAVLAEAALKDTDSSVRQTAVEKITDQKVLALIVQKDVESLVRLVAIRKVTDVIILKQAARQDPDSFVRKEAIRRLMTKEKNGIEYTVVSIKCIGTRLAYNNEIDLLVRRGMKIKRSLGEYENALMGEDGAIEAKAGYEFVELALEIKPLSYTPRCLITDLQMETTDGKKVEPMWDELEVPISRNAYSITIIVKFIANKGAGFKTLAFNGIVIDLEALGFENTKSF